MSIQTVYAELIGAGSFPTALLGDFSVYRDDWGKLVAFVTPLKREVEFQNNGYVQLSQAEINQVKGTV